MPDNCPFCKIATTYPPSTTNFSPDLLSPPAFVVLSTPLVVAFLDIMPLSPGHILLATRRHREKISDVTEEEAAELGVWNSRLSRVLMGVTGVGDWNLVQNNGAAAAQVVPHVHFHIIPRPALTESERHRSFTMFGRGQRSELDDEDAEVFAEKLRGEVKKEVERLERKGKL